MFMFMTDVLIYVSINFERLPCNYKHLGPVHVTLEQFKKGVLALVSCTWQNY